MIECLEYLKTAVEHGASDLFFVAGRAVSEKRDGRVLALSEQRLQPGDTRQILEQLYNAADREMEEFLKTGDDDFSFSISGLARFRVNAYKQRGSMAAVIRLVSFDIPDWQSINIPEQVMELAELSSGLVLVTGVAGSGKTTTQACIIDRINSTRDCHIVTLEDPIEYLHRHKKSIISQREISIDTRDYLSALRATVRQSPDVILLGEMRDAETIHTAMTAAETGHLVIATLHTKGAVKALDRIIDSFPGSQQAQVRTQLAAVLRTVVSQQMLPDVHGGMIPAFEILKANRAVSSMIRDNKNHQINTAISTGGAEGMISMEQSVAKLLREGKISRETALGCAENAEQLLRYC